MIKVLFVCLGNICRSPLAEAIFVHKVIQNNKNGSIATDSCGTSRYHIGDAPDPRTIEVARDHNIAIDHAARQLHTSDFLEFDYIVAMDKANLSDILEVQPNGATAEIVLMRDFDPDPRSGEVPDPYFGGSQGFENVYQILDRSIDGFSSNFNLW
jgi:protein-tyrosine phosphatase